MRVTRVEAPLEHFPLPESAQYNYRPSFSSRHQGVDIFAPKGTPVLAVETGRAYSRMETKGGKVAYLEGVSGWRYFYGHLDSWDLTLHRLDPKTNEMGATFRAGEPIGTVGNTGNAAGKPPHLHFQMKKGGTNYDPFDDLRELDPNRGKSSSPRPASGLQHDVSQMLKQGGTVLGLLLLWSILKDRR